MTAIRVADIRYPVTVLGPGTRVGVWVQGCHLACPGCMSRHTWDPEAVAVDTVDGIVDEVLGLVDGPVEGITISGGEPFEQADAVAELIGQLRYRLDGEPGFRGSDRDGQKDGPCGPQGVDVLVYTGLTWWGAWRRSPALVESADALIVGPYRAGQPTMAPWIGSANQRLLVRTVLGNQRFASGSGEPVGPSRAVQIGLGSRGPAIIGIPRHGDLERVEQHLASVGFEVGSSSWRL